MAQLKLNLGRLRSIGNAGSLGARDQGGPQLSAPSGFAFVTRVRNGVVQYAVSPVRNNAYATRRSS